jgi:hypothetical protein
MVIFTNKSSLRQKPAREVIMSKVSMSFDPENVTLLRETLDDAGALPPARAAGHNANFMMQSFRQAI